LIDLRLFGRRFTADGERPLIRNCME